MLQPLFIERTAQRIPLPWWNVQQPLAGLTGAALYHWLPLWVKDVREYDNHPQPEVAAATTVHELGLALLTALFRVCISSHRSMGHEMRRQPATVSCSQVAATAQPPAAGREPEPGDLELPTWAKEALGRHDAAGHASLRSLWGGMSRDQQAAMCLFTNPPVRLHHPTSGDVRDACIRVYAPTESR